MPIPKSFLGHLSKIGAKHETVPHRRVFTSHDKAATLHADPRTVVKTAVFQAGKKHALVLVPASKHIDKQKVKTAMNVRLRRGGERPEKTVDFAKEAWMKKNLLGNVGATPPFPDFFHFPAFVDNALLKQPKLYLNSGDYERSFLVNQANFKKILGKDYTRGSFSKSPP